MAAFLGSRQAVASISLCAALSGGCNEDDLYTRCKKDPSCRGQACVDVRAELYSQGNYKSASMLDCSQSNEPSSRVPEL